MNYNALTHTEILASKPGYNKESALSTLKTEVVPEDLNLSDGLVAMLVDKIILHKNKEGARSGSNAADQQKKRKATAEENLRARDKRITAGLLAVAGKFQLSEKVRNYVQQKSANAQHKEYTKKLKLKEEYDALHAKVQQVLGLNLPAEKWNQLQLHTMVKWFKRDTDEKMPSKKEDLLQHYRATCMRQDLPAPQLPDAPSPQLAELQLPDALPLPDAPPLPDTPMQQLNDEVDDDPRNNYESNNEEVAQILLGAKKISQDEDEATEPAAIGV